MGRGRCAWTRSSPSTSSITSARTPVGFLDAVDGTDVWMIQRGEEPRLAVEARQQVKKSLVSARDRILMATSRPSW